MAIRAHRMAGRAAGVSPASREGAPNRTQNVFVDSYANCVLIQARASAGCPDTSRQPSPQPPLAAPVALSGFGFEVAYECETVPYAQVPCDGLCPSVDARHCASRWPRPGCPQANDSDAAPQLRSHRQECRARQTAAVGGENINFDDLAPPRGRAGEGGPVANTGARIESGSDQPSHAAAGPSPPVGRPPRPFRSAQPRASRSSTDKRLGGDPHEPARPVVAGAVQEGLALRLEVDRGGGRGAWHTFQPTNPYAIRGTARQRTRCRRRLSNALSHVPDHVVCACVAGCAAARVSRPPRCPAATRSSVNHGGCWGGRPLLAPRESEG